MAVEMGVGGVGRERERLDWRTNIFCRRMFLQVCRSILCCSNMCRHVRNHSGNMPVSFNPKICLHCGKRVNRRVAMAMYVISWIQCRSSCEIPAILTSMELWMHLLRSFIIMLFRLAVWTGSNTGSGAAWETNNVFFDSGLVQNCLGLCKQQITSRNGLHEFLQRLDMTLWKSCAA